MTVPQAVINPPIAIGHAVNLRRCGTASGPVQALGMPMPTTPPSSSVILPDPVATAALARVLAAVSERGDVIGLSGELGAGKTTFARAFIEARLAPAGGVAEEVPSPTFTLVQIYETDDVPIWHFDLYRLDRPEDVYELGIEDAFADAISLIEWPERMGTLLPRDRLDVVLAFGDGETVREARLVGHGHWAARLSGLALS
jgi:tRNA threonylcarbamoyladenosine biosynthesis protein TsaE